MAKARPSTAKRPYRMRVRAEQVAATRERILATAMQLFGTRLYDEVSLDDVAAGAETTVQTVIRHFGSKDSLFAAVADWSSDRMVGPREGGGAGRGGAGAGPGRSLRGVGRRDIPAPQPGGPRARDPSADGRGTCLPPRLGRASHGQRPRGPARSGARAAARAVDRGHRPIHVEAPAPRSRAGPPPDGDGNSGANRSPRKGG